MSRTQKINPSAQARMRLISGRLKQQVAPLRRGVFLAPATITSFGLLAGFFGLVSAINSHFEFAAAMILIAFVCDGLDGRVARLSRTSSQFGVEYDSLSDVVAFGVAPAGIVYCWSLRRRGRDDRGLRARLQLLRVRVAARTGHRDGAADGGAREPDDLARTLPQLQEHQSPPACTGRTSSGDANSAGVFVRDAAVHVLHAGGRLRCLGTVPAAAR
jgi:hypothetical protein